jgi:hypothetical protein
VLSSNRNNHSGVGNSSGSADFQGIHPDFPVLAFSSNPCNLRKSLDSQPSVGKYLKAALFRSRTSKLSLARHASHVECERASIKTLERNRSSKKQNEPNV